MHSRSVLTDRCRLVTMIESRSRPRRARRTCRNERAAKSSLETRELRVVLDSIGECRRREAITEAIVAADCAEDGALGDAARSEPCATRAHRTALPAVRVE